MPQGKPKNGIEPLKILLEKQFLNEMARTISEIQAINISIDDARTNQIARIIYQKNKPRLKDLITAYKESRRSYDALQKEGLQCTNQKYRNITSGTFTS